MSPYEKIDHGVPQWVLDSFAERVEYEVAASTGTLTSPFPDLKPFGLAKLPSPCPWLYGHIYQRRRITATVTEDYLADTPLPLVEMISMAAGKPLLTDDVCEGSSGLRVWSHNQRKSSKLVKQQVDDVCEHFSKCEAGRLQLGAKDIERVGENIVITDGAEWDIRLARGRRHKVELDMSAILDMFSHIYEHQFDVCVLEPIDEFHKLDITNRTHIEAFFAILRTMADMCNCAFGVVQHNPGPRTVATERQIMPLFYAARIFRSLSKLTLREAEEDGVQQRGRYIRATYEKSICDFLDRRNYRLGKELP